MNNTTKCIGGVTMVVAGLLIVSWLNLWWEKTIGGTFIYAGLCVFLYFMAQTKAGDK